MAKPSLFPSILPDADFVDNEYNRDELTRKDYDELRKIAAEHDSDEVHGRMGREEIIEALVGLERV